MDTALILGFVFTVGFLVLIGIEICVRVVFAIKAKRWEARERQPENGKSYLDAYDDVNEGVRMPPWVFPEVEYNTYLGFVPRAGVNTDTYTTNRYHFRYYEDFPVAKAQDEIRIFVLGGSKAWGAGVTQRSLYTKHIEAKLSALHSTAKIRVICAAGNAFCTTQERIMLENVILRLSPDYVVMYSGRNDCYFGYAGDDTLINHDYFDYERILFPSTVKRSGPAPYDRYSIKLAYVVKKMFSAVKHNNGQPRKSCDPAVVVNTILTNVQIISDISGRHHFKFIFDLEPSIFTTRKRLSDWEQSVLARSKQKFPGLQEYSHEVYSKLRSELTKNAASLGYTFVDGDEAINAETRSVFSDNVHFGDRGYKLTEEQLVGLFERESLGVNREVERSV